MTVAQTFTFRGPRRRSSDVVHIGLVNNMPDAALRATELQFARLLKDAAGLLDVRLHFFSLPEIARSELARSRMEGSYADATTIPATGIDALIVTGAEPLAENLRDEPYWESFTRLIDWAKTGTISTMFSCLAAHAAVLHLDRISRHRLPQKLSGVFACENASDALLLNVLPRTVCPQSRYNALAEAELRAKGYTVLSRLENGDVNMFARPGKSLFLFLQGHPEYDETSLGREYLRDVGRYLNGERAERPVMPENYFDAPARAALSALGPGVRNPALLERFGEIVGRSVPPQSWRAETVIMFTNWLMHIAAEKAGRRIEAAQGVPLRQLRRA